MMVEMYKSRAVDLHVIYGQQTKHLYQQLWYIHTWINSKVIVNVPAITEVTIMHTSDGCMNMANETCTS